jgi:hypothetical protein
MQEKNKLDTQSLYTAQHGSLYYFHVLLLHINRTIIFLNYFCRVPITLKLQYLMFKHNFVRSF